MILFILFVGHWLYPTLDPLCIPHVCSSVSVEILVGTLSSLNGEDGEVRSIACD